MKKLTIIFSLRDNDDLEEALRPIENFMEALSKIVGLPAGKCDAGFVGPFSTPSHPAWEVRDVLGNVVGSARVE